MTDQDPSRAITDIDMAKLAQAIEHFRTLDKEIPAQVIATFLYVASHDDCSKVDLEKALAFSTASGSRNTDWLSAYHRLNKPGLGLIIKYRDPNNRRKQVLQLSPKGRKLVQELKQILYSSN
ncbi:winged helix-turn-helix transcriptional regulator [Prochlorococcus marinus XMU1412]|uniref:MarR family winged helix-turn-helix transcriptional regulator n=1 Tax=Prochlorococcus marinus TaxID=1219 RepID=UPI001ADAF198|nr:MarR family winged helix-turn-helix transcriptional regulator [Prochlorococcus marinus]MBO8239807.1 winged helix-turn-helix transcriptional regulator [Prochlorococcus marinus XMU1412]MBW3071091.1 MarR family transcriptional regulator [Prochlorococcus marinus str. MU1412]